MPHELLVNGCRISLNVRASTPLLHALRNHLHLTATRFGCGEGECGACIVWIDGVATASCQMSTEAAEGHAIVTLEGRDAEPAISCVHDAIIRNNAGQCGYCLSGIIMAAAALIRDEPNPTRLRIAQALDGNLCRCGAHGRILSAIEEAASACAEAHE